VEILIWIVLDASAGARYGVSLARCLEQNNTINSESPEHVEATEDAEPMIRKLRIESERVL
jgi:hypothetical protein